VARVLGIAPRHLTAYGDEMAKVSLDAIPVARAGEGRLVVMTGITPTPAGEGKTTMAIALADGLARAGQRAAVTLRQPSMGPVFGVKGGGTGGGAARVVPEERINLHFTGDFHAVESAHNLLAALADNAAQRGAVEGLDGSGLTLRRVVQMNDRALRSVAVGLGGPGNGPVRETGFDIAAASEVMAVLALASGWDDLRRRLGAITVGYTREGAPVSADDVGATGAMLALLKDAVEPNLVQTLEGTPALLHAGPFANIAHGCSSVLADRMALSHADYVITEAGFGSDLGLEKFVHLKARPSGLRPSAVVLVATVRALRWHGGAPAEALDRPDPLAVRLGTANLEHHVGIVRGFGLPVVVALNRFPSDSPEELVVAQDIAIASGASAAVLCNGFAQGGAGAADLADAVMRTASGGPVQPTALFSEEAPVLRKVEVLANRVYNAGGVRWSAAARRALARLEALGWDRLPVCVAKTPASLSGDPSLRNRPVGHTIEVADLRVSSGAGFVVALVGEVNTMPGLPRHPRALDVDIDAHGEITGI
jgi:formate--tetrahydrofolate ligase